MDFSGRRYYKINIFLLRILGLWPSQTTKCIQIQHIVFHILGITFSFGQLCAFITVKCNMKLILEFLSHFLLTFTGTITYYTYYINAKKIVLLMDEVRNDWNTLDDKKEIDIIEKYAYTMNIVMITITLLLSVGLIAFVFMEFLSIILDIVVPLNESRPCNLYVPREYFVDRNKYFFLLLLQEIIVISLGAILILSTGTIILAYLQHACGMLQIVCFRIERVLNNTMRHASPQIESIICNRIVHAVNLHRRTLKFLDQCLSPCAVTYGILIFVVVACLSVNLYRLLLPSTRQDIPELITIIVVVGLHLIYMFVCNYIGQLVINHSDDVYNTTCRVSWYIAPLPSQRLLMFLMRRTMKSRRLNIGKLFVASLECFATLCTTSLSYVTVLHSIQ